MLSFLTIFSSSIYSQNYNCESNINEALQFELQEIFEGGDIYYEYLFEYTNPAEGFYPPELVWYDINNQFEQETGIIKPKSLIEIFGVKRKLYAPYHFASNLSRGPNYIVFDKEITLDNGVFIIEAPGNTVTFNSRIILSNGSKLIVKAKDVKFNISDGNLTNVDLDISGNSILRVFSERDIEFKSLDNDNNYDFIFSSEDINDESEAKFVANDDLIFHGDFSFLRKKNNSQASYYYRGDQIYKEVSYIGGEEIVFKDEYYPSSNAERQAHVFYHPDDGSVVYVEDVKLIMNVVYGLLDGDVTINAEASLSTVLQNSYILLRYDLNTPSYSTTVLANYCDNEFVNWNYDFLPNYPPCMPEVISNCSERETDLKVNSRSAAIINMQNDLYPNPTYDLLYLEKIINATDIDMITVFSMDKKVVKIFNSEFMESIDVSNLNEGQYILEIIDVFGKKMTHKFIKI